ncbi:MAG TPA: hypothetical protein VFS92_05120, partial [Planctomycetota bacterium]|nr:hypothetical protein [Planctomycetota bacterium]
GSFSLGGLEPGEWMLVTTASEAFVRISPDAAGPIPVRLEPRFVTGRVVEPAGHDSPSAQVLALPAGVLEAAFTKPESGAMFVLLAANWRRDLDDVPLDELLRFRLAVPVEGPYDLYAESVRLAAESPVRATASADPAAAAVDLQLRPAVPVRVRFEGLDRPEGAVVVARNEAGVAVAVAADTGSALLHLVPGRYRLRVFGPRGAVRDHEFVAEAGGEEDTEIEVRFK